MKKYLLIALNVLCIGRLSAQNVGIGTTSPTSKLEVVGNTKTTNLQLTTGAANLRMLRSDANGNAIWTTLDSLGGWQNTGNSGTSAGINFLGTIDSVDLVIKADNFETARFLANPITAPGIVSPTDRLRLIRRGTQNTKFSMAAGFQLGSYAVGSQSLTQLDIALSNGSTAIPDTKVMTLLGSGQVGIGNTAPHGLLQFPSGNSGRKIVLSETNNNANEFFGFGVGSGSILKYQVDSTSSSHVFYAGVDSSSSNELMRITGTGTLALGTSTPNPSAIGVFSSTTKGLLIPRMTTDQRDAIVSPATFLEILNVDDGCTDIYNGTTWIKNCGVQVLDTLVDVNHPLPNSWATMANFGGTTRRDAVGFSIGTLGYVGTGVSVSTEKIDFWEYDSETDVWTQKANVPGVGRHAAVGFSIGSKGFIGTGLNVSSPLMDFWEYNPATNVWTAKANFGGGLRSNAIGVRLGTKAYVGTGKGVSGLMDDFYEYNPSTNVWTAKANVPGGARNSAVGFAANGNVYVGTGINAVSTALMDFWQYDVPNNMWTQKADFGGGLRSSAVGFAIGTKGYIGTGSNNSNVLQNDFWEFDPAANSWTAKSNFTGVARNNAVGFSITNKGYIGTGSGSSGDLGDFREYLDDNTTGHTYAPLSVAGTDIISDGAWALNESTGAVYKWSAGNVGIGNQSPHGNLQFSNGAVKRKIVLFERADNDHQFCGFGRSSAGMFYQTDSSTVSHIFSAGSTPTTSNELMRITGTGNVGIGNASPLFSLVVQNDLNTAFSPVAEIATGITDLGYKLLTYKGETANVDGSIATQIGLSYYTTSPNRQSSIRFHRGATTTSGGYMSFTTGTDVERMRIDNAGNVGIGTTTPNGLLQFSNPNNKRKVVLFEKGDNTNQFMGFGRSSSSLTYQVDTTTSNHVFLAGANSSSSTELMRITGTGRVGIGTSSPDAPLHIAGTNTTAPSAQRTFFSNTGGPVLTQNTNNIANVSIHAEGNIWADGGGFFSTSDKRIKKITGLSNSADDLSIINQIEITDYHYVDTITNGKVPQKKVIAQQLKAIYPSAVGQNTGVIPSVYALAEKQTASSNSTEIVTGQAHGFSTGDQVKLILENKGELMADVTVIDEHTFTVNKPITTKIFVYGKKVDDLLNVDYDAVAMLNVSATQELSKQIDILIAANSKLAAENETLKAESISTTTTMQVIQSRLTDLEAKLNSLLTPSMVQNNK